MKHLTTGILLTVLAATASAQTAATESRYISPCSSWRYESTVSAYVCSYYDSFVEIPDAYDQRELERTVRDLERKVAELEARVARLEAQ